MKAPHILKVGFTIKLRTLWQWSPISGANSTSMPIFMLNFDDK